MTKLICPFCGEKIEHIEDGWCNCKNRCTGSGSIELWLQFLRTRKALDVAVDALKEYADRDNWGMGFAPWLEDGFKDALYTEDGYKTAEKALEQITAISENKNGNC